MVRRVSTRLVGLSRPHAVSTTPSAPPRSNSIKATATDTSTTTHSATTQPRTRANGSHNKRATVTVAVGVMHYWRRIRDGRRGVLQRRRRHQSWANMSVARPTYGGGRILWGATTCSQRMQPLSAAGAHTHTQPQPHTHSHSHSHSHIHIHSHIHSHSHSHTATATHSHTHTQCLHTHLRQCCRQQ